VGTKEIGLMIKVFSEIIPAAFSDEID